MKLLESNEDGLIKKKKSKIEKNDDDNYGFLGSSNTEKINGNEPKTVKLPNNIAISSSGSGVESVTIHKKTEKVDNSKNSVKKANSGKDNDYVNEIESNKTEGNKKSNVNKNDKNVKKVVSVKADDATISAVLTGVNSYVVGGGGTSSW